MKKLALAALPILFAAPVTVRAAEVIDLEMNLWVDGRWICGGVLPVRTGEDMVLCEARHRGKTVRLRGELNALDDDQYEIHARIVEIDKDKESERNKFLIVTAKSESAEISDIADGREKYRFKADIIPEI